jgi:ABC-2 type transport system ATP-binding protein
MSELIELKEISKKYKTTSAVDNISLNIKEGEIFGLLGPNGAGKSTTVSMLSTVLAPTSGEITICGKSLRTHSHEIKQMMGVVPQELSLYQTLNARDNLSFFGSLYGLTGKRLNARVDEIIELIELKDKAKQSVNEYSGGMKRRLNIGIALMNNPKILILDEPTVGIDPQSRNHILETVKELNQKQGMTVIYTSHYMEEVEFLCERIAIIDFGKLKALGTKDNLKKSVHALDTLSVTHGGSPESIQTVLKNIEGMSGVSKVITKGRELVLMLSSENADAFSIMTRIKEFGIPIISFHFQQANLESIFLQITGKSLRE